MNEETNIINVVRCLFEALQMRSWENSHKSIWDNPQEVVEAIENAALPPGIVMGIINGKCIIAQSKMQIKIFLGMIPK